MRHLFYEAGSKQFGIVLTTSDPHALKQQLYQARRKAEDPELADLSIVTSPANPDTEVWIVRNAKEKSPAAPTGQSEPD